MLSQSTAAKIVEAVRGGSTVDAAARKYKTSFYFAWSSVKAEGIQLSGRKRRLAETRGIELVRGGITRAEAAKEIGVSKTLVQSACVRAGVPVSDESYINTVVTRDEWHRIDWKLCNVEIAAMLGVSRERVRQVRAKLGKPKTGLAIVRKNGRKEGK